ncbi:MAG TPA: DUF4440 domain-containing protein [Flavitalea sp.]|nr:DUF4440 domain-containing protein [Flavitalea sp.]
MRKLFIYTSLTLLFLSSVPQLVFSQKAEKKLSETILLKDSLFWKAYNSCDTAKYNEFIASDVEFYHDKGGITLGLEKLLEITKKNLCGPNDFRLRREAVPGSVKVFPMERGGEVYGAIISGEHVFYIRQAGQEKLDGLAKFTHLWLLKDGEWKMTRILSYDHGPAPQVNNKKEIKLSEGILAQYAGNYEGPKTGAMKISPGSGSLILSIQQQNFTLYPEAENRFFIKGRDLNFEFVKKENTILKMVVRENGQVVEEALYVKKK